jgi:hypothetical protein
VIVGRTLGVGEAAQGGGPAAEALDLVTIAKEGWIRLPTVAAG